MCPSLWSLTEYFASLKMWARVKKLLLFKHVRARRGGKCSGWEGCDSEREDVKQFLRRWPLRFQTKDRGWLDAYRHTIMSLALAGEVNASLTFLSRPLLTFCLQTIFYIVLRLSYSSSFSHHMQPRFSFSSGVWVPERKSSLEIVLILLDSLLENLFAQRPRVFWI